VSLASVGDYADTFDTEKVLRTLGELSTAATLLRTALEDGNYLTATHPAPVFLRAETACAPG